MKTTITITEYERLIADKIENKEKNIYGYTSVPEKVFEALKTMIQTDSDKSDQMLDFIQFSYKKGIGEVITARNYVGLIMTNDGTNIEILPKIANNQNESDVKELLVKMLKTLKNSPFKTMQAANVNTEKMPLLEVFIRMFINEVSALIKHGLKCGYQTVQENSTTFKGKLKVAEHIRLNNVHKERSYVEFDSFELNRPENRLIKSTTTLLYQLTGNLRNKTDLNSILFAFADVELSTDYDTDFQKVTIDRNMSGYDMVLQWCSVFLKKKSFTSFAGKQIALAILFPMETLFESYIASVLRKHCLEKHTVKVQDHQYYLFDTPQRFRLKPDIVLENQSEKSRIVMDTKWKKLSADMTNWGISQADMYQMYVYHKKYTQKEYNVQKVVLIYPLTDKVSEKSIPVFQADDGVIVEVLFVDLLSQKSDIILSNYIWSFITMNDTTMQ